jgi:hypothetical protein
MDPLITWSDVALVINLLIIELNWTNLENTHANFIQYYIRRKSGDIVDPLHATMAFRGVDVRLHSFLTSALGKREWSLNFKPRLL